MSFSCSIIADSIADHLPTKPRLTTFIWTYPRIIHSEVMTHRMLSKSSASSRAISIPKMIGMVTENPYVPSEWSANGKGMVAKEVLGPAASKEARLEWLVARDKAVTQAERLLEIGVHKQLTNRLLEPFLWHTVIISGTDWSNFWHLRCNENAHPDLQTIAKMAQQMYESAEPSVPDNGWHIPFIDPELGPFVGHNEDQGQPSMAVARCARVSYLTHDGVRSDVKDMELHDQLFGNGHMAPFEHVARAMTNQEYNSHHRTEVLYTYSERDNKRTRRASLTHGQTLPVQTEDGILQVLDQASGAYCGNFNGWIQKRKMIPREKDILAP